MTSRPVFALHPGKITSKNDGDRHYISAGKLQRLYGIPAGSYIVWDNKRPETFMGRRHSDYLHLYPLYSGDYDRYENEIYLLLS